MESPLEEANPNSVDELYNKEPLSLTDEELERLVEVYRAQGATNAALAANSGRKGKPKGERPVIDIDALVEDIKL